MAQKVLALTEDGRLTYCTCPPELRGKGRCNHVAHQENSESPQEFIERIESGKNNIHVDDYKVIDNMSLSRKLISNYGGNVHNPQWEDIIRSLDNPFNIGKEEDGSYEEAKMVNFSQEMIQDPNGNSFHLIAEYEFRGKTFKCDFGYVPALNDDGTVCLNGVRWRVLPVVSQNKSGVISYRDNVVIRQKGDRNICLILSRDKEKDTCKIYGKDVKIEDVRNFLKYGKTDGLNSGQVWALNNMDPIAFERFPQLRDGDLESLRDLPVDSPADLEWRKCIQFKDIVKEQYRLQMRRMGVTFRTNLAKRQKLDENDPLKEELDEKYPLFYQVNLTENIKKDLVGRSNVQFANDLNPISSLSQSQKISFTGPGGFHKDKAPYELRMPHKSHQYVIDHMDVSSGKNVGLTATLSNGYIDERGFIVQKPDGNKLEPSDFIPFKTHNDPNRGIMAVAHMKQACPLPDGEDPIVKTKAWENIKGAKIGKNLLVAYVPMGDNHEDAVLISEDVQDSLTTVQPHTYSIKESNLGDLSRLKVGQRIERKDKICGEVIKNGGIITSIGNDSFTVETTYKMGIGDKLAGRHGNKCTVSKVLSRDEMPKVLNKETGLLEPAQIVMSPIGVPNRKNIGQIMECNESLGYDPSDLTIKHQVVLNDGHKIEATCGKQFIMRLNHIAEKKLTSYADEIEESRDKKGSRVGEMESILLSTSNERLKVLDYLRHQESYDSINKLNHYLKSVGVDIEGVNWNS